MAKWIWVDQCSDDLNRRILARKVINLETLPERAVIQICADTRYELYVNGRVLNEGPARYYANQPFFDQFSILRSLVKGENVVALRVHHWGRGTGKSEVVCPGFWLRLNFDDALEPILVSDSSWLVRDDESHGVNAPVICGSLGYEEHTDGRRILSGWDGSSDDFDPNGWHPAAEMDPGPGFIDRLRWSGIEPLARNPIAVDKLLHCFEVRAPKICDSVSLTRLLNLHRREECNVHRRFALATVLESDRSQDLRVLRPSAGIEKGILHIGGWKLDLDDLCAEGELSVLIPAGRTPVCLLFDHNTQMEEFQLIADAADTVRRSDDWYFAGGFDDSGDECWSAIQAYAGSLNDKERPAAFHKCKHPDTLVADAHAATTSRIVMGDAADRVAEIVADDRGFSFEVYPADSGNDVEILLDFGLEINAYIVLDIESDDGVVVDGNIFERIHNEEPQWTWRVRSSFRYITREGRQSFMSSQHFGGRYMTLTFRNLRQPLRVHHAGGVFTHYPVSDRGSFECSEPFLNKIWRMSRHTLLCCMEDTFTDCPTYEQTYWLGDARNEALVVYSMFGETDFLKRCCELPIAGLERNPLVEMRLPTTWKRIIPVWSFLWVRMCWEYYWYSGDRDFLCQRLFPAVRQMLENCERELTDQSTGLLCLNVWQFFDWTGIDGDHRIVTHNNIFYCDSLRLGARMAELAGDVALAGTYRSRAEQLVKAINRHLWSDDLQAYADSLHDNGTLSASVSQPANTLALLFNIAPEERAGRIERFAVGAVLDGVVPFGSPFANFYLLEYLGEADRVEEGLEVIRKNWGSMMDDQSTTFWESFSHGTLGGGKYPTRSYCHAWSSGPAYFLTRYVLGIELMAPAGREISITPRFDLLRRAEGAMPLPCGGVSVAWERMDSNAVRLRISIPKGVNAEMRILQGYELSEGQESGLKKGSGRVCLTGGGAAHTFVFDKTGQQTLAGA